MTSPTPQRRGFLTLGVSLTGPRRQLAGLYTPRWDVRESVISPTILSIINKIIIILMLIYINSMYWLATNTPKEHKLYGILQFKQFYYINLGSYPLLAKLRTVLFDCYPP